MTEKQNHRLLQSEYVGLKMVLKKMMCKLGMKLTCQYNENINKTPCIYVYERRMYI